MRIHMHMHMHDKRVCVWVCAEQGPWRVLSVCVWAAHLKLGSAQRRVVDALLHGGGGLVDGARHLAVGHLPRGMGQGALGWQTYT